MKLRRELDSPEIQDLVEDALVRATALPDRSVRDPWPENDRRLSAAMEPEEVKCQDCGYPILYGSPRYRGPRPPDFVKVKLKSDLDDETLKVLESARRAAAEIAKWPSWKLGCCNCPKLVDDALATWLASG